MENKGFKQLDASEVFTILATGKYALGDFDIRCTKYEGQLFPNEYRHVTVNSIKGDDLPGFGRLTFFIKDEIFESVFVKGGKVEKRIAGAGGMTIHMSSPKKYKIFIKHNAQYDHPGVEIYIPHYDNTETKINIVMVDVDGKKIFKVIQDGPHETIIHGEAGTITDLKGLMESIGIDLVETVYATLKQFILEEHLFGPHIN